ncbi:hypothetical protein GS493_09710 [Rhodococcus hoagii]|nr:hypothetical protein [Prescottella equi]
MSGSTLTLNGTGTTGLSVPASTTYQLPKIQIVTTNTNFDVKLNTAGTAAQYGTTRRTTSPSSRRRPRSLARSRSTRRPRASRPTGRWGMATSATTRP